jgi:hypothetical protein
VEGSNIFSVVFKFLHHYQHQLVGAQSLGNVLFNNPFLNFKFYIEQNVVIVKETIPVCWLELTMSRRICCRLMCSSPARVRDEPGIGLSTVLLSGAAAVVVLPVPNNRRIQYC